MLAGYTPRPGVYLRLALAGGQDSGRTTGRQAPPEDASDRRLARRTPDIEPPILLVMYSAFLKAADTMSLNVLDAS